MGVGLREGIWKQCAGIMRAGCRDGQGKMAWGKKIACFSFVFFFTCRIVRDGMQALWGHFSYISVLDRVGRRTRVVFCFSYVFLLFFFGYRTGFWCGSRKFTGVGILGEHGLII